MDRVYYDLHIHSALSPCGDKDMTPNNIVNMARLKGLDVIALTDHNSCGNCAAAIEAGSRAGIKVLPGMELCTAEEVHVLCLFVELDGALEFWKKVKEKQLPVKNRAELFGSQFYMDSDDNIIEEENILLTAATSIKIDEVSKFVSNCGGIALPAHIDRSSYSVLSVLGFLTDEMGFRAVELSKQAEAESFLKNQRISGYEVLCNSDAHRLWEISEREFSYDMQTGIYANLLKFDH